MKPTMGVRLTLSHIAEVLIMKVHQASFGTDHYPDFVKSISAQ
jgi:hypothetical protein